MPTETLPWNSSGSFAPGLDFHDDGSYKPEPYKRKMNPRYPVDIPGARDSDWASEWMKEGCGCGGKGDCSCGGGEKEACCAGLPGDGTLFDIPIVPNSTVEHGSATTYRSIYAAGGNGGIQPRRRISEAVSEPPMRSSVFERSENDVIAQNACLNVRYIDQVNLKKFLPALTTDPEGEKRKLAKRIVEIEKRIWIKECRKQSCTYSIEDVHYNVICDAAITPRLLKQWYDWYLARVNNDADCWSRQALDPGGLKKVFTIDCNNPWIGISGDAKCKCRKRKIPDRPHYLHPRWTQGLSEDMDGANDALVFPWRRVLS